MTREEIMQLTGRELDAAVAERVMGWKRGNPKCGYMPWYPPGTGRYLGGGRLDLPKFSTDIAAAWEVVDRLRDLNWHVVVKTKGYMLWHCVLEADFPPYMGGAIAPTAPEAICRAALLAALKRSEAKNGGGEA